MEFFSGNIYFSLGKKENAYFYYKNVLKKYIQMSKVKAENKMPYLKKTLLAMINMKLEEEEESKIKDKLFRELLWSLRIFLNFYPKDKLSISFYKKMFLMNYKMGNDLKIENIYFEFKKNFPNETKISNGMVDQILNEIIDRKKINKLIDWVSKNRKREVVLTKEKKNKTIRVLASLLFKKYEKMAKAGLSKKSL